MHSCIYNNYQNIKMKHKKNIEHLITHFLKNSPRSQVMSRNNILPPQYAIKLDKIPTDQSFIKNFIIHIQCSYMYNYYGAQTTSERLKYLQSKNYIHTYNYFLNKNRNKDKSIEVNDTQLDKKTILFQLIKALSKEPQAVLRYSQIQQFMEIMTIQQTIQLKRYLIHLYKWILNRKKNLQEGDYYRQLCQDLSETLLRKINDASQNLSNAQSMKNTQEELNAIQNLEEAREKKKIGDLQTAKQKYEKVYNAKMMNEKDKMQALEYLCQRGASQNDEKYLLGIIQKIRQKGGLQTHEKYVLKAIQKMTHSINSEKKVNTDQRANLNLGDRDKN